MAGPDAGPEQRLVRVDVAHADDQMVVHQRELDRRRCAGASRATGSSASNAASNGSGPRRAQQRVRGAGVRQPQHRAEAARVVVAQRHAVVEHEVDVVVRRAAAARARTRAGCRSSRDARAACPPSRRNSRYFAAAVEAVDDAACDPWRARSCGNRPAQPRVIHMHEPRCGGRRRAAAGRGAWFRLRGVRASSAAGAHQHSETVTPALPARPFVAPPNIP